MVSLQYPWPETPPPGETIAVAPGIHWLSMPLPFRSTTSTCGWSRTKAAGRSSTPASATQKTRALWEKLSPKFDPVKRVIVTHYHPDHAGNADWLCKRFGVELWTTQGEYLTAHAVRASSAGYTSDAVLSVFQKNGLRCRRAPPPWRASADNRYAALVPDFPHSPTAASSRATACASAGTTGSAIIGHGHAPEHLSLVLRSAERGDRRRHAAVDDLHQRQRLVDRPRGRSAAPVPRVDRPLSRASRPTCWCCPSHGKPFRGAHVRVRAARGAPRGPFRRAEECAARTGRRAPATCLPVLFRRPLDAHQTFFAMGEAIAHLHYLYYAGRCQARRIGADGIMRYAAR